MCANNGICAIDTSLQCFHARIRRFLTPLRQFLRSCASRALHTHSQSESNVSSGTWSHAQSNLCIVRGAQAIACRLEEETTVSEALRPLSHLATPALDIPLALGMPDC